MQQAAADIVTAINDVSTALTKLTSVISIYLTSEEKTEKPQQEKKSVGKKATAKDEDRPAITIEQVRAILAEKSQAGLTSQVKDLLTTFGSVKLSGIDPARYGDLIEAAKALQ